MESQVADKLFRISEVYYLPSGYHTPEHRQKVIENARRLGSLALKSGHSYDPIVLDLSAAWHDAGLAFNPSEMYFKPLGSGMAADYTPDCSERVSAMLFEQQAAKLGLPSEQSNRAFWAIMASNPDMRLNSIEGKILAAADISAVGLGTYEEFKDNTRLLWEEAQMKGGEVIDWEKFVAGSINYLGKFMGRKIHLTPDYYNGEGNSAWHAGALANIVRLAQETWPQVSLGSSIKESTDEIPYIHEEILILGAADEAYQMTVYAPLEKTRLVPSN